MKKNHHFVVISAIMLILGFLVIGCDTDTDTDTDGGIDSALVGTWGLNTGGSLFEITADGRITSTVIDGDGTFKVTTSAGRISIIDEESVNYVVEGTTLKFSNPSTDEGLFAFLINFYGKGEYYKIAGSGTGGNDTGGGTDTGGGVNPFIGTWRGSTNSSNYFTFKADSTFTYSAGSGTYTYSGKSATLRIGGVTYPIEIGSDGSFTYLSQKFKK
jgi:hypothetical protein